MAFHEKAGRSQAVLFHFTGKVFLRQVATVATLPSALFGEPLSLGASWVFSFQPVLPPVRRPCLPPSRTEVGPGHLRSHRNSALGFYCTSVNYAAANLVRFVLRRSKLQGFRLCRDIVEQLCR